MSKLHLIVSCKATFLVQQFIEENLGPTLEAAGYGDLKLMICDDQRPLVPHWARGVLASPTADSYVDGFAVHWYTDDILGIPDAPGLEARGL